MVTVKLYCPGLMPLSVNRPSEPEAEPTDELLKNTLAPASGFFVSALVITPVTVPYWATANAGKTIKRKMSQGNRIV